MTAEITFPRVAAGRHINRETGIEIKRNDQGFWATYLPNPGRMLPDLAGITAKLANAREFAAAKVLDARLARAADHAEALALNDPQVQDLMAAVKSGTANHVTLHLAYGKGDWILYAPTTASVALENVYRHAILADGRPVRWEIRYTIPDWAEKMAQLQPFIARVRDARRADPSLNLRDARQAVIDEDHAAAMPAPTTVERNRLARIASIDEQIAELCRRRAALVAPPFQRDDVVVCDDSLMRWTVTGYDPIDPSLLSLCSYASDGSALRSRTRWPSDRCVKA